MIITPVTPLGANALIPQPPQPHPNPQQNDLTVVVHVIAGLQGQPRLIINQQSVTWQDLTTRLIDIYKTRAQKVLFVKADDGIPWQDVATVIAEAHNAGVDKVGLITAKIEAAVFANTGLPRHVASEGASAFAESWDGTLYRA